MGLVPGRRRVHSDAFLLGDGNQCAPLLAARERSRAGIRARQPAVTEPP